MGKSVGIVKTFRKGLMFIYIFVVIYLYICLYLICLALV